MTVQYREYYSPQSTQSPSAPQGRPLKVDVRRDKLPAMDPTSRELPMPNMPSIFSLNQAHATLLQCHNKLVRARSATNSPTTPGGSLAPGAGERLDLWLERWEASFHAFLKDFKILPGSEDMVECQVLKANHIYCTILASPTPQQDFDVDYKNIIELAGEVLQARFGSPQNGRAARRPHQASSGLDVRDPVIMVASRCNVRSNRRRANELMARYFQ